MKKCILPLLVTVLCTLALPAWDDEQIFTSVTRRNKPNLMVLMDNSGSMNEIIYYPKNGVDGIAAGEPGDTDGGGFNPRVQYSTGYTFQNSNDVLTESGSTRWRGRMVTATYAYEPSYTSDSDGMDTDAGTYIDVDYDTYNNSYVNYWVLGAFSGAMGRITAKDNPGAGQYYLTLDNKTGTFLNDERLFVFRNRTGGVLRAIRLYGISDGGNYVRYAINYLRWLYINATDYQREAVSHFSLWGTFDVSQTPSQTDPSANPSNCNCDALNNVKRVFTRIQVAREVTCKVATDNRDSVKLGVFHFDSASAGGARLFDLQDLEDEDELLEDYKEAVWNLDGETWTPLAEALSDVWRYFKPGSSSNWWEKSFWPVSSYYAPSTSKMTSPCEGNYVIIVTDGESTQDNFADAKFSGSIFLSRPVTRTVEATAGNGIPVYTWNYANGWGDYVGTYDTNPAPGSASRDYCPYQTCWYSNGTDWLDDVAYFLFHQDMMPDSLYGTSLNGGWPGDQNIRTYAIGFNADNDMLRRTADNGGGQFFTSSNFDDLSASLQAAIDSILMLEQEMMFTSFAAPKQSFTGDLFGYIATFIPRNGHTIWEGHLKAYELDESGNFPTDLNQDEWDAYDSLLSATAASRTIYTFKGGARVAFDTSNIAFTDLGVANDAQRDTVVNFIRGANGYDPNYKLGDVFHFNPVVVGKPIQWKTYFDSSYKEFYDDNVNRTEAIYIGTNDGMIHCINASTGQELWGFVMPSHLTKIKNLTPVVSSIDRPEFYRYYVDGKAIAKDVKDANGDWHTVLIFGMGVGGKSYAALDVTDPEDPEFLWEFTSPLMAYTEARPVIADFNDGNTTFTGVALAGGYNFTEVPVTETVDPTCLEGKSLYLLKVFGNSTSGQVVKRWIYGATTADSVASGVYTHTNVNFQTAITASPALLDANNDGITDYMYVVQTGDYRTGEAGGSIWKINTGGSPLGWVPTKIFQAENSQTMFLAPTLGYDASYNLWIFIGTGRRSQLTHTDSSSNFDNLTGQFIAFVDNGAISSPLDIGDLKEITSLFTDTPDTDDYSFNLTSYSGFWFTYTNQDHEVFYEPTPIFINNTIYFNTFAPVSIEEVVTENSCTEARVTGTHYIYRFKVNNSNGVITISEPSTQPGKILGFGLLSSGKYVIYFGGSTPGGFSISNPEMINLSNIFGPLMWLENKK